MKLPLLLRVVLSVLLLACVGFLDYIIPYEANTAILYAFPVFMFSYTERFKLVHSIMFACFAALVWGVLDFINNPGPVSDYLIYNIFSRIISFSIVAALINRLIVEKK